MLYIYRFINRDLSKDEILKYCLAISNQNETLENKPAWSILNHVNHFTVPPTLDALPVYLFEGSEMEFDQHLQKTVLGKRCLVATCHADKLQKFNIYANIAFIDLKEELLGRRGYAKIDWSNSSNTFVLNDSSPLQQDVLEKFDQQKKLKSLQGEFLIGNIQKVSRINNFNSFCFYQKENEKWVKQLLEQERNFNFEFRSLK